MAEFPNRHQIPLLRSFDDLEVQPWDATERYSCSKLLGHLFFAKMFAYADPAEDVIVNLVDPGFCRGTALHRDAHGILAAAMSFAKMLTGRPLEEGASTYVDAAVVKGKETHGCFVMDWKIRPFTALVYRSKGQPVMQRLWDETMQEYEFAGAKEILEGMRK